MTEALDPLTLPLRGSRLIEASAGTGKTWTIAALYLRLILGHGDADTAPVRPLMPGEILVMTFTKAATRELSDRIRRRLVEAAAWFRGEADPRAEDPFLDALLAAHPEGPARSEAAWRLAMAAEAMDDAAIHTIDAWCQRMLREHAFDSGCLFDEELQADESALIIEAVHDYWRQEVYPLSGAALSVALDQWADVARLAADVKTLRGKPLAADAGRGPLSVCIEEACHARAERLSALKRGWVEGAAQMLAWLEEQWARKDCPIDKRSLGSANGRRWLGVLSAWAADASIDVLDLGTGAERLTATGVAGAMKAGAGIAVPAPFDRFEALMTDLQALPAIAPALRVHAAARVLARVQQLKAQAGTFGFADMLDRLSIALDAEAAGDKALRLRQRIVEQYPVALIDEFQDTSPVQLGIFDRLYRIAEDEPSLGLLLIGDPKQSIYGFRGADIYSYLGARRATAGRQHVLGTNHRSTQALVAAVNRVFERAEQRPGRGAFLFDEPGRPSALPFTAVAAKGRAERLVADGGPVPALTFCVDPELRGTGDSRDRFSALCAERIVALLDDPAAGFDEPGRPLKRLRPADIAVLVRTGLEAASVRRALRRRGVASVYLSDKDSVFATDDAADLLRLLQAIASPRDVRLARTALATRLLGLDLPDLLALAVDDEAFDARCDLLRELHDVWQAQGVLAMLRRALHGFGLPARWLARPEGDGERRLTDVLHLAELLQAASGQLEGEQALVRWMAGCIEEATGADGSADEAQVLRLESDADLVKVVTVHKSKGLEYPVVCLPFPAHFRAESGDRAIELPQAGGGRTLHVAPTREQVEAKDLERLREDLRLLYVALTRARHALWVGAAALKVARGKDCSWHRSALGSLLSGASPVAASQVLADVRALAEADDGIAVQIAPAEPAPVTRLQHREALPPLVEARAYAASFDRSWAISSYSSLVRDVSRAAPPGSPDLPASVLRDDEPPEAPVDPAGRRIVANAPWHRFPRGAFAGNFLHDQLEWLAGEGFALAGSEALQQALVQRCERQGWSHRADDVLAWLRRVCVVSLPPVGVALEGLADASAELEFWFPSDGLRARAVDALCHQHVLPGRPRPALPERALRGMLMGFADLVFEHEGRWWVLDYKSNALGPDDRDYTAEAMAASMLEHRYDVQAVLYLLALHRLLKARLRAVYDPARHLGGAVYLYLRGIEGPAGGAFHLPPPLDLLDRLDAMLQPDEESAC